MERQTFRLEESPPRWRLPIAGDVCLPVSGAKSIPVVALAHAWGDHRGSGLLPSLQEALAAAGFAAVRFDFPGSGFDEAGAEASDAQERRAANTFAREVDDLERVVTAIFEHELPGRERTDSYRIGVAGVGEGGAVAVIEALRDSRVKALALAGAPAAVEIGVPATQPPVEVARAARDLAIPYLVVHGEADEQVPLAAARGLFFAGNERAEMEVLAGAGHDLSAEAGAAAVATIVAFFKKRLM